MTRGKDKIPPTQETRTELVPFSESQKIAHELLERYKNELVQAIVPGSAVVYASEAEKRRMDFGQGNIYAFLKEIPESTRARFFGHGLARGDGEDALATFINILQNSSLKGSIANLVTGPQPAWTSGSYLILSRIDKRLSLVPNEIGLKIAAGAYVLDTKFYPILDELRARFPEANIIRANELAAYMDGQIKKSKGDSGVA